MKQRLVLTAAAVTVLALGLSAQQLPPAGAPAQGGAPAGAPAEANQIPAEKQPQPKSQKEYEAVVAMINAAQGGDRDQLITASDKLIKDFKDTEFRPLALEFLTQAYQEKRDVPRMMVYGEMALKENPKNYRVQLTMAKGIADGTKEFDLDKDEKVSRVTKMVNEALTNLKDSPRPNPQITDDQWVAGRKDYEAQGYEILGMVAAVQKKYDEAEKQYKKSIETANQPDPIVELRLADSYTSAKKFDECIATIDKVLAGPAGQNGGVAGYANNLKKRCTDGKAGK